MKLAAALACLASAAVVLAACGSSDEHGPGMMTRQAGEAAGPAGARAAACAVTAGGMHHMRVTGMRCAQAAGVVGAWDAHRCLPPTGASRAGCRMGPFRCASVATGRGYSVSCAMPGRSIAFTVPRR